jgi:pimeloyl-ACP methyl ester carboxylesterase
MVVMPTSAPDLHLSPREREVALHAEHHPGRGPGLLLAHGFGQTLHSWAGTRAALAEAGWAHSAFDMRGHGRSGRNPSDLPYRGEQFVDDIARVATAAGDHPVLVGASMGGLCGLMAQALFGSFSSLVLVDITPRWESAGIERIFDFMQAHPGGFDDLGHAADEIARYLPHRSARKRPEQLEKLLRQGEDGRWRWHWDPRLLGEFARDSAHMQDTIAALARRIDVPVLLISGGRSDVVSERTIGHFLELIPHAGHRRLPQATHMLAGDDNDAFSHALIEHLGAQFPSTPARSGARNGAVP